MLAVRLAAAATGRHKIVVFEHFQVCAAVRSDPSLAAVRTIADGVEIALAGSVFTSSAISRLGW